MRFLLAFLLLMSCTRHLDPLALFTPDIGSRPLVTIKPMIDHIGNEHSLEAAKVFSQAIFERLEKKNRLYLKDRGGHFLVKMQLMQHEETLRSPSEVAMSIHLEILDLRGEKPTIILQEVLNAHPLLLTSGLTSIDWEDHSFRMSPLGLAYRKLSREIAGRIEDYILLAKREIS